MISGGYYKSCLFDRNWKVSTAPMVKGERLLSQLVRVCEDFQVAFTDEFLLKLSSKCSLMVEFTMLPIQMTF